MVRLHDERTYDATVLELFELLTDPAFQEARSRHVGTIDARCARREEGALVVVSLEETRETGFGGQLYRTCFVARWDRAVRRASWTLSRLEGPGDASASGTLRIDALGERRSRLSFEGELEVRVRFFGAAIEQVAKRALGLARAKEARFIEQALRERR
jgi:hypothetical protein